MCLSWDEPETAEEARMATAHQDVVCDHSQMSVIKLRDNSRVVTFFLPVQSADARLLMYPCKPEFIGARGDNTRGLLEQPDERAKIPCFKQDVMDYWCPEMYTHPHQRNPPPSMFRGGLGGDDDGPKFRSLGSDDEPPPLEQGKVCENADGSFTFVLRTSTILEPLDVVDKMRFEDQVAYRLRVNRACLNALLRELKILEGQGKLVSDHILPQEDGEVTMEAAEQFMSLLYPALQGAAGCDILVAVPPLDKATGKPSAKDNAAFTFAFHLDADQHDLPILGLAHNLDAGTTLHEVATGQLKDEEQANHYWIVTNAPPKEVYAHIDDEIAGGGKFRVKFPSREQLVYERCHHAGRDATEWNLESYERECYELQYGRQDAIREMMWTPYLRYQQVGSYQVVPAGEEKIAVANLKGSHLSPLTTTIHFPNYPSMEPPVPLMEMYASIAAAKVGVKDRFGNDGWWTPPQPQQEWTDPPSPKREASFEMIDELPDFPEDDDNDKHARKRFRSQAEMEQSLLGIQIDPVLGPVTATALRKEIQRRVDGPVTRSRSAA